MSDPSRNDMSVRRSSSTPTHSHSSPEEKSHNEVELLLKEFRNYFNTNKDSDIPKCTAILPKIKVLLIQFNLIPPWTAKPFHVKKELMLARETLELASLLSIRNKDTVSFERHVAQLKPYYYDSVYTSMLLESERKWLILGLYLLGLLAQSHFAEFHTELELIPYKEIQTNMHIRYPVQLEQRLMEGSYNKILTAKNSTPAQYYNFFVDQLVNTVRDRVSESCSAAYESFPVEDARLLLLFTTTQEVLDYAKKNQWEVKKDTIYFNRPKGNKLELPSHLLIKQTLGYATELERIV